MKLLKFMDRADIAPTAPPSLCDSCAQPGACCKAIKLVNRYGPVRYQRADWKIEAEKLVERNGLPFYPIETFDFRNAPHLHHEVGVIFGCHNLTPEGRCGDYANRPELCKEFEPGKDMLCVMHPPTLADDEGHVLM